MFRGVGAGMIVAVALTLSACVGDDPAPSPTPTWSEAEAYAAAEKTYRAYVDALNQVDLSDPATFEPVYALTTGEANAGERESLSSMSAEGMSVSGDSKIESFQGAKFILDPLSVVALACTDVSGVDVANAFGVSQVADDRPDTYSLELRFVSDDEAKGGLLISSSEVSEEDACAS